MLLFMLLLSNKPYRQFFESLSTERCSRGTYGLLLQRRLEKTVYRRKQAFLSVAKKYVQKPLDEAGAVYLHE